MAKLSDLHNAIVKGNLELAVSTTQEALQENIDPQTLISDYLIKGMEEIGTQFEAGKAYVPNLLMSARAMKGALELLKPYMENDKNTISLGKVVIGTVKGDLHDIGKNLVSSMLEGCGFEVINLGVDVSDEKFVDRTGRNTSRGSGRKSARRPRRGPCSYASARNRPCGCPGR